MSKEKQANLVDTLPIDIERGETYSINQPNPNSYTHGMFKYPCKFIPEIPRWVITKYGTKNSIVLDPFMGSGTTLLEASVNDMESYGTEIDEIAKLITKVKTTSFTKQEMIELNDTYQHIIDLLHTKDSDYERPRISNLEHWFPEETIEDLGIIKKAIDNIYQEKIRDFFSICFVSIIKKVSFADDTSPKPYVSTKIRKIPPAVTKEFSSIYIRYREMLKKLSGIAHLGNAHILKGDALSFQIPVSIDLAITSPPYINAFDYGRTMRLENIWLGYLSESELREKKKEYVGTEKISMKEEAQNLNILNRSELLQSYYAQIEKKDLKRALIVKRFFEDMELNIKLVYDSLNTGGIYTIVIGNSMIRNVSVESWKVLKELSEQKGFTTDTYFSYEIRNPYIRIPRNGMGGKINADYVLVLKKG